MNASPTLKPTFTIAVRDLVQHLMRHGDLRADFAASIRGAEGIRAHQRIQRQRPPHYQPEVSVSTAIEHSDFHLLVNGRIDGVMVADNSVIVEEIKTTRTPLKEIAPDPIHWGQAQCYAYLWAKAHRPDAVSVHLTYVHLESDQSRTLVRRFTMGELEQFFNRLIEDYIDRLTAWTQWLTVRDASIRRSTFPYPTYRPGQREMAKAVYRTIRDGSQVLVQAATGIGKTMAALFPAIKALVECRTPKVVFLTARTTGRLAAERALFQLQTRGLRLRWVAVTAKEKVCLYPDRQCLPEECPCARGHFDRIHGALQEALTHEALTRERIVATAENHKVCPFELTLELVEWADCIIGDYNYAFAPGVAIQRLFGEDADHPAILVDEAHNLVDRSREMFSAHLDKQPLLTLRRSLKKTLPSLYKSLGRINAWMATARRCCRDEQSGVFVDKALPEKLLERVRDFLWVAEKWLMRNEQSDFRQPLLDLFFAGIRFVRVAEGYDDRYVTLFRAEGDELRMTLFCIDPSNHMRQAWERCQAAILFSATLTPATYFQEVLGCHGATRRLNLPSPFPQENFAIYVADRISTYFRDRDQSCPTVSRTLEVLVRHNTGHYLLFFPSYAYMEMVHHQFVSDCPDLQTILQTRDMQEVEREDFLNQFRREVEATLVGFAVLGGIFGEGIDLKGEHLTGAAIVGVGLPGICAERDVIRHYYDGINGLGFEFAYQNPGITRVLQAAGRVIRSKRDRGVVLLIDRRYAQHRYRTCFPLHWQVHSLRGGQSFRRQLSAFWQKPLCIR